MIKWIHGYFKVEENTHFYIIYVFQQVIKLIVTKLKKILKYNQSIYKGRGETMKDYKLIQFINDNLVLIMTVFLTVSFMYMQNHFFANNDLMTLVLIGISVYIMFLTIFKMQVGNKRVLRAHTKTDSTWYFFLSSEKTIPLIVVSIIISILFALMSVFSLKSIVLAYGATYTFLGLALISLLTFLLLNKNNTKIDVINDNLQYDIANHINTVFNIFLIAIFLNVIASILLGYFDMESFFNPNNKVTLGTYAGESIKDFIPYNGNNYLTKVIMNIMILIDNFKMAITSIFIDNTQDQEFKVQLFVFIGFFFMNLFKLFSLALSLVLLQKGFERLSRVTIIKIKKIKGR